MSESASSAASSDSSHPTSPSAVPIPPVVVDPEHAYHPPLPPPPPPATPYSPADWESYAFSADIAQLLSLIINTFYSSKDIFLRELLSNASDALDKARYRGLLDDAALRDERELHVRIVPDAQQGTLCIADTGIGMTKADLVNNLGTIARSGTKAFMEAISAGADLSMIGQFGVGFYSSFLVAERVQVHTKSVDDEQWCWESEASGNFEVGKDPRYPRIARGTHVLLFLKAEHKSAWTDERTIRATVKKHNEFIQYPIQLRVERERDSDESAEATLEGDNAGAAAAAGADAPRVQDVTKSEENQAAGERKVKVVEWEVLNTTKPIWTEAPSSVLPEQYEALYKTLTNDWEAPLAHTHFKVEGQIEFTSVLFVPRRAPFDLFAGEKAKTQRNLKLYVRRVFVTDDSRDFCPEWLAFVKGLVDSEDLPLSISRESLQVTRILSIVKKHVTKKAIECFAKLQDDAERYRTFYEQFSKNLKLGIHEDAAHRTPLAELLRFYSTKSPDAWISLSTYVQRMKPSQRFIYYITGEGVQQLRHSPFIEGLQRRDLEALFMTDAIDESYMVQQLKEYGGKSLKDVTKAELELLESDDEKREEEEERRAYEATCTNIKQLLGERVEKVVVSHRVVSSPSANMERLMKAQALRDASMSDFMVGKRTLEINPHHRLIRTVKDKVERGEVDSPIVRDLVFLLYDTALLVSGFSLPDPAAYAQRVHKLIGLGLGVEDDAEAEAEAEGQEAGGKADMPSLIDERTIMEEVD